MAKTTLTQISKVSGKEVVRTVRSYNGKRLGCKYFITDWAALQHEIKKRLKASNLSKVTVNFRKDGKVSIKELNITIWLISPREAGWRY